MISLDSPLLLIELFNKIFEHNKKNFETKVFACIIWIVYSSFRKTSKVVSLFLEPISKSDIWYCVNKLKKELEVQRQKRVHRFVAIDETCLKINGKVIYVYGAIDPETKEVLGLKAFTTRNYMTTMYFVREVLRYCSNTPVFLVDGAPWYRETFNRLGLTYLHVTFGKRNPVERLFGYLKRRTRIFFNNINVNFKRVVKRMEKGLRDRVALQHYNSFLKLFELYYIYLR